MTEEQDRSFIRNFATVVGVLVVITVVLVVLSTWISGWIDERDAQRAELERERIAERTRPVGRVRLAGEPPPEREEPVVAAEETPEPDAPPEEAVAAAEEEPPVAEARVDDEAYDGRPPDEIYRSVCQACHLIGVAEAPILGDSDAWAGVLDERGLDGLVQSVIDGRGAMPARAGRPGLTDAEIRETVRWMLEESDVAP